MAKETTWANERGSICVISRRKGAQPAPSGYTVVRIDRKTALGNPHPMTNEKERVQVINAFRRTLDESRRENGELWRSVEHLADRVKRGENIALACWCAPKPCHGDIIGRAIKWIIDRNKRSQRTIAP